MLYVSTKEAQKKKDHKFEPPTESEVAQAGRNGYVLYDAGKKYDVLDVKVG